MTLQANVMLQELEKHNIKKINPCIEFICCRINAIFKFHGGKLEDLTFVMKLKDNRHLVLVGALVCTSSCWP